MIGGLSYLCKKHSRQMARRGKIWHGKNVFKAGKFVKKNKKFLGKI